MQNLNINKITNHSFSKEEGTIKGLHCNTFACLLIKQRNSTEEQPLYAIKVVKYNDSTQNETPIEIPIEIDSEIITSDLEYLALMHCAFLATSTRIFIIDLAALKVTAINIPSRNDDKCIAAAWNCEQDSLAVAYDSGRVTVFCINFLSYELTLLAEDHPDNKGDQNVYLGWGDVKKQFKGKNVAEYLKESHPPESKYKHLSQDAFISWQFGERYFAVNALMNNQHVIRIFDNECKLFHTVTNAKVPGMCSKTVYRSKHNTLATICQLEEGDDSKGYVVMHERNGEYYNTIFPFSSKAKVSKVQDVKFSSCGRLFAILSHSEYKYHLDLYTQSNFMWLHKFRFTDHVNTLVGFKFRPTLEDDIAIEMIFQDGVAIYDLARSINALYADHTVFVQSGNKLQEFEYKKSVIPPCGVTNDVLSIDEVINNVVVQAYDDRMTIGLVDSMEVAHIFRKYRNADNAWCAVGKINLRFEHQLPINWYKFSLTSIDDCECLVAYGVDSDASFKWQIPCEGEHAPSTKVSLAKVTFVHKTINNDAIEQIFEDAIKMYAESKVMYLLLTVTSHDDPMDRLYCIDLQKYQKTKLKLNDICWSRRVEKGAILICMANDDGAAILEMPRGNIELIMVRPIILRNVHEKIINGMFLDAYHLVRRYALKLDVLYDLAPELFHQNVKVFVESLGSAESVIKFLLPLKNASTLTQKDFLFVQEYPVEDKKNKICDAIIDMYSEVKDASEYRIVCIALFVKHNHDTYEALKFLVSRINGMYTAETFLLLADVVNMLKIYGDANEMYKQALTLYDVELVSTIAQVAGMDPQVYRKFLTMCDAAEPVMKRFLMANEGGNFKAAGLYMMMLYRKQSKTLEEFIEYVKDKDVLDYVYQAMDRQDGDATLRVSQLLCEKYVGKNLYKEAASVLCKAGMNIKAIHLLISGVCWMEALKLIMHSDELSDEAKHDNFEKLAHVCIAHGKHREAANIYLERCNNVHKALDCYLMGLLFKEVVGILEDDKLSCQIDKDAYLNVLKEKLLENMKNTEANVDARGKSFKMHFERLKVVREDRKHRADCTVDGDDAYSEMGSVTTRSHSSYASTTTRRTRKLEMKLRSLRHGGKFEDIALMRELYDVINDVFNMAKDLHTLVNVYAQYAHIRTDLVSNKIVDLEIRMKNAAGEIWLSEYASLEDDVLVADFNTENIVYLGKEYRSMPEIMLRG